MSFLGRCPSYRDRNKMSKERQGPTLGVRFQKVGVGRPPHRECMNLRCPFSGGVLLKLQVHALESGAS